MIYDIDDLLNKDNCKNFKENKKIVHKNILMHILAMIIGLLCIFGFIFKISMHLVEQNITPKEETNLALFMFFSLIFILLLGGIDAIRRSFKNEMNLDKPIFRKTKLTMAQVHSTSYFSYNSYLAEQLRNMSLTEYKKHKDLVFSYIINTKGDKQEKLLEIHNTKMSNINQLENQLENVENVKIKNEIKIE